jgi:hypothetical protein
VKQIVVNPGNFSGETAHRNSMLTNPNMSKTKGLSYIDTIQRYIAPRIVNVLGLPGNTTSIDKVEKAVEMVVYPNPSEGDFSIRTENDNLIKTVKVFDIIGREVRSISNVNESNVTIARDGMNTGIYFVKVLTEKGEATRKLNLR